MDLKSCQDTVLLRPPFCVCVCVCVCVCICMCVDSTCVYILFSPSGIWFSTSLSSCSVSRGLQPFHYERERDEIIKRKSLPLSFPSSLCLVVSKQVSCHLPLHLHCLLIGNFKIVYCALLFHCSRAKTKAPRPCEVHICMRWALPEEKVIANAYLWGTNLPFVYA